MEIWLVPTALLRTLRVTLGPLAGLAIACTLTLQVQAQERAPQSEAEINAALGEGAEPAPMDATFDPVVADNFFEPSDDRRPALIPTRYFAGRPVLWEAELSPDGEKLSFLRDISGQNQLVIASPTSGATLREIFLPEGFNFLTYRWAGNDRLLVEGVGIYETEKYYYRVRRLFLATLESGDLRLLIDHPFVSSYADIIHVNDDGSEALIQHPHAPDIDYPSVYRYDLTQEKEGQIVQPMIEKVTNWSADDQGVVRMGFAVEKDAFRIWYRASAQEQFAQVAAFKRGEKDKYHAALKIISGSDEGYVLEAREEGGPVGLHRYNFETRQIIQTIYENPDWDIERVWFHEGEPLAATYTDDARQIVWFDPANSKLYAELNGALGGGGIQVWVTSRSEDDTRMLIWAGHEADPGVLYFLDREKQSMSELTQYRPKLDYRELARPRPFTYAARDGQEISAYLTLPRGRDPKSLPLIIMPHGGPFGVRDTLTYNDEVQLLANRGYAVIQPNFRGSGGYGSEFYDLGVGEVGRGMQDDVDDAMDWAVSRGIADPDRVCVVGGSYGGYSALWAVLRNPERYRCAASWAGVTDWDRILRYDKRFLTRDDRRRWRAQIEGEDDFNLKQVSPYRLARGLNRPVLLAHGTRDVIVPFKQFEQMMEAAEKAPVPPTPLVIFGAGHSFDQARYEQDWYDGLDAFLAEHNPADQVDEDGNLIKAADPELDAKSIQLDIPVQEPVIQQP